MRRLLPLIIIGCCATILAAKAWWSRPSHSALATAAIPPVKRAPYDPNLTHQTVEFWAAQVRSDPSGALALSHLSNWYLRSYRETGDLGDVTRAEQAARRSIKINPRNHEALTQLARCAMTQHRFQEALTLANRAAALAPDDSRSRDLRTETHLELGNYEAARKLLYKYPVVKGDTTSKALRARLCEIDGKPALALRYLQQAQQEADENLDVPPESVAWYHMRVGNCLAVMGRAQEAEGAYKQALSIFPRDYRTMGCLARLKAGQGAWKEAIKWGAQATDIVPTPEILTLVGDAHAALGNQQEAAYQYQLVETIGQLSRAGGALYDRQRALFYADHNRHLDEALKLSRQELKVRKDIYAYDTFAWACYKKGLLNEADGAIKKAMAHQTQDALLYYHAGMIASAHGDKKTARQHFSHALTLNPHFHPFAPRQIRSLMAKLN